MLYGRAFRVEHGRLSHIRVLRDAAQEFLATRIRGRRFELNPKENQPLLWIRVIRVQRLHENQTIRAPLGLWLRFLNFTPYTPKFTPQALNSEL